METQEMISVAGLKDMGWTDGAITKYLGQPDTLATNPHYKSGAPMRLYVRRRAIEVMESADWQNWYLVSLPKRKKLSDRLKQVSAAKRQELIDMAINDLEFYPPESRYTPAQIVELWHYQATCHAISRGNDTPEKPDPKTVDTDTLARWEENHLRHNHSNYDWVCSLLAGQIGHQSAYVSLRVAIGKRIQDWIESL
jgi:hypothetical protein